RVKPAPDPPDVSTTPFCPTHRPAQTNASLSAIDASPNASRPPRASPRCRGPASRTIHDRRARPGDPPPPTGNVLPHPATTDPPPPHTRAPITTTTTKIRTNNYGSATNGARSAAKPRGISVIARPPRATPSNHHRYGAAKWDFRPNGAFSFGTSRNRHCPPAN